MRKARFSRDCAALGALWLLAFIPLVALRQISFTGKNALVFCCAALFLAIACIWARKTPPLRKETAPRITPADLSAFIIDALFLVILVYWQFHLLMLEHWYSGTDETLTMAIREPWFATWENIHGRPLAGLPFALAAWLTPDSFWGYIILQDVFRYGVSLCLYLLFRLFYPQGRLAALSVAILFILSPTESSRYLITGLCYYSPMFFMTLAALTYFYSYQKNSRLLLVLSCSFIAATLLQYESPLLLFGALPFLLLHERRPDAGTWAVALYLTCFLMGLRLIHHMLLDASVYQSMILGQKPSGWLGWAERICRNFLLLADTTLRYFHPGTSHFWKLAVPPGAIILVMLLWAGRKCHKLPRIALWQPFWCLLALTLIILPHTVVDATTMGFLEDFIRDGTIRLGFFTSVVQAVLLTVFLLYCAGLLKKYSRTLFICFTCLICAISITHNAAFQARGGNWNSYLKFEDSAELYKALHSAMPEDKGAANAFFIILPEGENSHIGWSYNLYHGGWFLFGMPGYQGRLNEKGELMQLWLPGYANSRLIPKTNCNYLIFKALPGQKKLELVSRPKGEAPSEMCAPRYMPPLDVPQKKLPYFDDDSLPN